MDKKHVLSLSLILLLFVTALGCSSKKEQQAQSQSASKVLLVSFDGFRYDYLNKTETPNFDQLVAEGIKADGLIPVFPSKTFPNHYSIVTGLYPEHTGFVGNTMYDPKWNEWYRIRDRDAVENGKWYGGEPIWNTLEKQGIKTGTMFWVGSEADIQGMHPTHWKTFDSSMSFEARIDTVTKWMSAPGEQAVDFATLYFEEPDHTGHGYGPQSDSVKTVIQRADSLVGYLREKMKASSLWDNTDLIIVSDHGMAQLSADKTIMLDDIIDMDRVQRMTWGPMTMIQPKEGASQKIYEALKANEDHYRVFKKENPPERYHLKGSRRVMDIVLVADLGYTFLDKDRKERFLNSLPAGTHGYDNNEKAMQALFLAHGPDFKNGGTVDPFQNVHIYDLINHLMGTQPAPNDGSLDSVRVLLK